MDQEYKALTTVLAAFYHFHRWEYERIIRPRRRRFQLMSDREKALLPWFEEHVAHLEQCIEENQVFTQNVALTVAPSFGAPQDPTQWAHAGHSDFDKVRATLLQVTREWSDDGADQREIYTERVVRALNERYPVVQARQNVAVLVPGCGLAGLVYRLVLEGYSTQGNEFSYHMLVMSNFILNHCRVEYRIYPYIHKFSHVAERGNQVRGVAVRAPPSFESIDLAPDVPYHDLMTMAAGSFTEIYKHQEFDCIVTVYFLDTASNVIEYIDTIHGSLRERGLWINFGPLLWHFEDDDDEERQGMEISRQDLMALVRHQFAVNREQHDIKSHYSADPRALGQFVYHCTYFECEKQ